MRVTGAVLLIVLSASPAVAQADARSDPSPIKTAPVTEAASKSEAAPATAAEAKKPAHKKTPATVKPVPASTPAAAVQGKARSAQTKAAARKSSTPATNGSADAAASPAKPSGLADTYAVMPIADRVALQNDLTWGGDYSGPIDGEFSERLVEAVKSYQKRHKGAATGVLSNDERAALAAAVAPRKADVGWRLTDDPVSGARLGLPGKFATQSKALPSGTRWSSEQGQFQIETFRIDTGATLEAVFEQQKKLPRRRVTSSALQTDSFVITGMQGLKKMVVRGYARDGEVRGLTILYDQAMEGSIDPLIGPMAGAFVPFSGVTLAGASGTARRKVEYGTGIVVSASGYVVTARGLIDGCNVITMPGLGTAERVATDAGGELALLRVYGARNLTPIALIGAASGDGVTLLGIADPQTQGGDSAISAAAMQLGAAAASGTRALSAAPALGFAGAVALDVQGHVAGVVTLRPLMVAGPASAAPRAAVVPAERLRNFLEANFIAPASGASGVEAAKASLLRVICVRT